ncbi:MAG: hypothetical protein RIS76_573 [Verrucomicrobiota bacterium]
MSPPAYLQEQNNGLLLAIRVQPRASRTELAGILGAELKIKVTAPPVDSAANDALVAFLADTLDLPKRAVTLIRGQTSRHKVLRLEGLTLQEAVTRLEPPARS